jgi:hypothetical protein
MPQMVMHWDKLTVHGRKNEIFKFLHRKQHDDQDDDQDSAKGKRSVLLTICMTVTE